MTFCARVSCVALRMAVLKTMFILLSSLGKCCPVGSPNAIGERGLDCLAGLKSAKDGDRLDCCKCEFGQDVVGDRCKPDDLDAQLVACSLHRLQICTAIASQTEFEGVP